MSNFRKDFPIFEKEFDPKGIIYFDSAATTLKPKSVISRVVRFYEHETSNAARGNNFLTEKNDLAVQSVRSKTASFIKAKDNEISFTHNCTDSINIVATSLNLQPDDEVIVSILEHHSNLLPWKEKATVKIASINKNGVIDLNQLEKLITAKTKIIAITYASNVTGAIQPVEEIINIAKKRNLLTLIDAAQAVSHFPINVKQLDCDFMVFSSHKMFGPSGVGILYAKTAVQYLLTLSKFGGGMANKVETETVSYKTFPYGVEAGTMNIEGILGFGAAIDFIQEKGFDSISNYLEMLENYFRSALTELDFLEIFLAPKSNHIPIFTLVPKNRKVDINNLSQMLSDSYNILIRGGYQCCQLVYMENNLLGGIRASLHVYNTKEDIDRFIDALKKVKGFFK